MIDLSRYRFGVLPALTVTAAVLAGPVALAQDNEVEDEPNEAPPVVIAEAMDAPYFVTWVNAAVREQPDGGSPRLETLSFGEAIFVTGRVQGGPWYRVELDDGTIGYVWMEVLEPLIVALPGQGSAPGQEGGPPDVSDDNTMDTAQVIGVIGPSPAVFQGTVGPADSSDFYRFTLDDWTQLTVTLGGLTADADITLLDENGQYLGDSVAAGTESELIEYVAGPGTYFIEIYMYQGETPYEMTIIGAPAEPPPEDTVGNAPEEAHSFGDILEAPVSFDEWVGSGDPADYYAFSVSDRATVTVSMDGLASDADISLEDDFGSVLASSAEGGTNPEYMQSELEPGTYYLAVVPFSGNTSYHLEVTAEPAGPAPEDLAGNTVATARAVTLTPGTPAEFRDWVGGADTSDYYTFTVEAAGTFQLALDGLTSDADVELLAEDGTSVLASSLLAGTDPEAITHQLQAGTYYVRVYVFSGSTDYRLEMTVR